VTITRLWTNGQCNLAKAASNPVFHRRGRWGPPSNAMFLGSPGVSTPIRTSIRSAVFAQLARVTDWQTSESSIAIVRIRCGLAVVVKSVNNIHDDAEKYRGCPFSGCVHTRILELLAPTVHFYLKKQHSWFWSRNLIITCSISEIVHRYIASKPTFACREKPRDRQRQTDWQSTGTLVTTVCISWIRRSLKSYQNFV